MGPGFSVKVKFIRLYNGSCLYPVRSGAVGEASMSHDGPVWDKFQGAFF